jgi:ribosomal protein S6--L-glutamate ligase
MNTRCVAVIANRDREQIDELKEVLARSGASVVELPADGSLEAAHFEARAFDLVMVKLTTDRANRRTFAALRGRRFRYLNSLRSVKLCQSRRATFAFANRRAPHVATPNMFVRADDARGALAEGRSVWVRRDAHNIPLDQRVLGVARTSAELGDLVDGHAERTLLFQEYLGSGEETYKAYVVGEDVVVIRRTDTAVESATLPKEVNDAIRSVGRAFAMSVYGIDFFYREGQPIVLDVNDFPSFRGIPEASRRICDFVATTFFADGR